MKSSFTGSKKLFIEDRHTVEFVYHCIPVHIVTKTIDLGLTWALNMSSIW